MQTNINLQANQTIVFIGDSITDTGRMYPAYGPFGFGYVNFAANLLMAKYSGFALNIVNSGASGNTIRDLARRWKADCLDHKPDILSIMIGINDLWRQHEGAEYLPDAVYPNEYESTYRELLSTAKKECEPQLVLMEPFMFCDDMENKMFRGLRAYIDIVNNLAQEFDAVLVPLQSCIDEQIKKVPPGKWSDDMVHPYVWVHAWISQRWLGATGL